MMADRKNILGDISNVVLMISDGNYRLGERVHLLVSTFGHHM